MTVVVVAAVIEDRGSFLVTRRPDGAHLAGLWEFPGGKIDGEETHAEALGREMREELDAQVDVGELVHHTAHDYGDRVVALYFYRCALLSKPRPLLGQQMRWVPRAELPALGFPPADQQLITMLAEPAGSDDRDA